MAVATDDLSTWLVERAGVSPKFLGAVLATCDEQMIGTVDNLAMLQSGGQLGSVFKPVIAASIESALSGGGAPAAAAAAWTRTTAAAPGTTCPPRCRPLWRRATRRRPDTCGKRWRNRRH